MKCSTCNGHMTPMLFSWFCPKDCDKPPERAKRQTTPGIGGPLRAPKPWDPVPGVPSGIPIISEGGRLFFDYDGKRYTWNPLGHWEWFKS